MRLININTLELEFHPDNAIPAYIILSHRWLRDEDEVKFEEYPDQQNDYTQSKPVKKGFDKIASLCRFVRKNGYVDHEGKVVEHVWVDTCCIDKRSSSELSESINSMARWYRDAELCVAYLSDVPRGGPDGTIWRSEWFTRGWCLQELLFPREIVFCDEEWGVLGRKSEKAYRGLVSERTGIDVDCLKDRDKMLRQCVAKKMSWASRRVTKRREDLAYCLLGLFNIHMALLYGEGTNAFARLQEEIVRQTDDESVFAWTLPDVEEHRREWQTWKSVKNSTLLRCPSILAPHPRYFERCRHVHLAPNVRRLPYRMTNKGIEFECKAHEVSNAKLHLDKVVVIELNCGNVVDLGEGVTEDRSCLMVLGNMSGFRYMRLEFGPTWAVKGSKGWEGDGHMWHLARGSNAEGTTFNAVGQRVYYIQALSFAKAPGGQGFSTQGGFMTLSKALAGTMDPLTLGEYVDVERNGRGKSGFHSSQPSRDLEVPLDHGNRRRPSHSPRPSGDDVDRQS